MWEGPQKSELPGHTTATEAHGHLSLLPGDSIVPPEVDFDRLLASLQDLSELVVEGEAQVTPVPGGAQFRTLEPIPLKLYRNGIMMFDGPFRPFYDPYTQVGLSSGPMPTHPCLGMVECHSKSLPSTEYTSPIPPISELPVFPSVMLMAWHSMDSMATEASPVHLPAALPPGHTGWLLSLRAAAAVS